jgi:flagellin-like hook-associated protein FlgL
MALNDISLTAGMRANLLNLQGTVELLNRTQDRLSTGKKVNTPMDNPLNYFVAKSLTDRASDISVAKDSMSEGIQTLKAADNGIKAVNALIAAAKGIATSALSASASEVTTLETQFNAILTQINNASDDSFYKGVNLLASDTLAVNLGDGSTLSVTGFDATANGLTISQATGSGGGGLDWEADTDNISSSIDQLDAAVTNLRAQSQSLSSNSSVVTIRQDFANNMIATLTTGADNLTLADMNEEGANMLMLQTRQALGISALALSAQAAQSVLKLF